MTVAPWWDHAISDSWWDEVAEEVLRGVEKLGPGESAVIATQLGRLFCLVAHDGNGFYVANNGMDCSNHPKLVAAVNRMKKAKSQPKKIKRNLPEWF